VQQKQEISKSGEVGQENLPFCTVKRIFHAHQIFASTIKS